MGTKIVFTIVSATFLFSCSNLSKEKINGVYYQKNADNTTLRNNDFDFKSDRTYRLKSSALLEIPGSNKGRFEVDDKRDLVYLSPIQVNPIRSAFYGEV